jgi:magnesium transporter
MAEEQRESTEPADDGDVLTDADLSGGLPWDERVADLMARGIEAPELAEVVEQQDAPDAAEALESLGEEQVAEVLGQMDDQLAADALAQMQPQLAVGVLDDLIDEEPRYAALILSMMAPDDAADLLQWLDEDRRERAFAAMEPDLARDLRQLVGYDAETAGGLMTTRFLALGDDMTVQRAIEIVRAAPVAEDTHSALVTDRERRLVGIVPLRKLLIARPGDRVADIMSRELHTVPPEMDREDVAREIARYDFDMIPVVDAAQRVLGIVTVDDVLDIIRAEQTEDVQKTVGAGAGESIHSGLADKMRGRFPWLAVSVFTSSMAAFVVLYFEPLIEELAILAVMMPVIAALAGNAGNQALAVTLRGIVLDELRSRRVLPLIVREGFVGLLCGAALGVLMAAVIIALSGLIDSASWRLGVVAAVSMALSTAAGTLAGSSIPLAMRRLGADPAQSSVIFLIMITDATAFATFLGCASVLSEWLLGARA